MRPQAAPLAETYLRSLAGNIDTYESLRLSSTHFQVYFAPQMSTESILLQPRPFAQVSGRLLLLPLLPHKCPLKPLPSEIWWKIAGEVMSLSGVELEIEGRAVDNHTRLALLTVCKGLKVGYSNHHITALFVVADT